ncbi:MAG: TIGR04255 family protein [Planctomycetota bacterium]
MTKPDLPSYERPPVIEVVCGVQFEPLEILMTHLGLLWQQFPDYPTVIEVAPLIPVIEKFGEEQALRLHMTDLPPMARTWFLHRDETGIVQIQKDRFLHNWKKVRESDDYPRFGTVIGLFRDRLTTFETFLRDVGLGDLRPTQYELTYVNHIPQGEGWGTMADFGRLFPGLTSSGVAGFLPSMEQCNLRSAYVLPNQHGRLHVTIRTATGVDDKKPVIVLELTARGFPGTADRDGMWRWFDLAHEWIVRGFSDLTSPEVQKAQWKRTR